MGTKGKEIYMYILGALVIIACFAVFVLIVNKEIPVGSKDAVMLGLGILLGMGGSVVNYFFGSSKSSADKNETLGNAITQQANQIKEDMKK